MSSSNQKTGTIGDLPALRPTLPEMLLHQTATRPDDLAVIADDQALTFAELTGRAAHLAERLRSAGAGPDDLVGLYLSPSAGQVTATWGALLAGAAYVPLAPDYPEDRVSYMIANSRPAAIVTEPALRAELADLLPHDLPVIALDDAVTATATPPRVHPAEADAAYVIYTSGTTGRPKGVVVEHAAIANQMLWLRDEMGIDPSRTILRKTPVSFDAAQWETLALAVGTRVVVGAPGVHRDPSGLIESIIEHGVTDLQCVPTLLQALVDDELFERCTSLRAVFSGGEALSKRLAARFRQVLPDCRLVNLYGPTECTINASSHVVTARSLEGEQPSVPIGRPVADTTFHVLDAQHAPVADGVVGELHIGGVQLARGYLDRPEETEARFGHVTIDGTARRLYRTGDLVTRDADGVFHFVGRVDNQVKLRGHRIELDEVRVAIENHDWVKNAAVLVRPDDRTGSQHLVACVELNPREAALMDQGNHGAHHQSKKGRVQVRAQLANLGLRDDDPGASTFPLPGKYGTAAQRRRAFARKTYRFFEGGPLTASDVLDLLHHDVDPDRPSTRVEDVDPVRLGAVLRNFGQFHSDQRILPKYAYASPGALYATQLYVEVAGIPGLPSGIHYHHPVRHELVLVAPVGEPAVGPRLRVHLLGKRSAIEAVYRNNVLEVLRIEAGHMLGLFDEVLPEEGLGLGATTFDPAVPRLLHASEDHHYLGGYDVVPFAERVDPGPLDTYVQAHPDRIADLAAGQYRYEDGGLRRISDALVLRKHVIAINQQVYDRADLGISLISRSDDPATAYVDLGRRLQRLQLNPFGIGFMSSGYSSETGNDLPSARRITSVLRESGLPSGPSYFFLGGRISPEQIASEGMKEDAVHTMGPAEMIKQDIAKFLPRHMIPGRVVVLDELPHTANGKVDLRALETSAEVVAGQSERVVVAPRTPAEHQVAAAWAKVMKTDDVSVLDDFFESGGNSLLAVLLVQEVNRSANVTLPIQLIFDEPTVEGLARRVDRIAEEAVSRLVALQPKGSGRPVVCWPGLGGYPMNLKPLARAMGADRPFYGVQAAGINPGEEPDGTVADMARHDVALIKQVQPTGPYTLWGYSFGARVAFEVAYQLEQRGDTVDQLVLIAPGSPVQRERPADGVGPYGDPAFVRLLYSVFAGRLTGADADDCVARVRGEADFVDFVSARFPGLDEGTVRRIVTIVRLSYSFRYTFEEMLHRRVQAPITILKVRGDDYSFLEEAVDSLPRPPEVVELDFDHYSVLRSPDVEQLAAVIRDRTRTPEEGIHMPHVSIKHFPVQLSSEKQDRLVDAISTAVQQAFGVDSDAISIAMEPVRASDWKAEVYEPEIEGRRHLLAKTPRY
ncbi:amino acid adenylation domain-containing protein [Saccharothrix saharensis]|uniref:Amino acid adenylation domain-containing protein n=1 Tax=Saccharothrix saharensis TaxID=571190 RepID=A0A543JR68_9PSEU|nr:amino acid adenylation domain-containing protein [Saccharothrix saharensis]TQM85318.1 amino acid adenylation domain-containing protein [Saccharothrix saharensis]